jgi:hypothetical protein
MVNGGVNDIGRPSYPANLNCDVAISVEIADVPRTETLPINIKLTIHDAHGDSFGADAVGWAGELNAITDELINSIVFSLTFDARDISIPAAGSYGMTLWFDNSAIAELAFQARVATE